MEYENMNPAFKLSFNHLTRFLEKDEAFDYAFLLRYAREYMLALYKNAQSEYEFNIISEIERRLYERYDFVIKKNYDILKDYIENGTDDRRILYDTFLLLDKNSKAVMPVIIKIKDGVPVFDEEYTVIWAWKFIDKIKKHASALKDVLNPDLPIKKMYNEVKSIKCSGALGVKNPPEANYEMNGYTNEMRDAQAWENMLIETGVYKSVNLDYELDCLLNALEEHDRYLEKGNECFKIKDKQ